MFGLPDVAARDDPRRNQGALAAGPDRHPLDRQAGARHLRSGRARPRAHRQRHPGARGAARRCAPTRRTLLRRTQFEAHQADLGYGLLLLRYVSNPAAATPAQIDLAAWSTVPNVPVLFWCFRVMVGLGLFFILLFAIAFYLSTRHRFEQSRWFLRMAVFSLPLPWIAAELGWIVAEYGRQPWAIDGVLPTFLGVSTRAARQRDRIADRLRRSSIRRSRRSRSI